MGDKMELQQPSAKRRFINTPQFIYTSLTFEGETAGDDFPDFAGEVTGVFLGDPLGEVVEASSSFPSPRREGGGKSVHEGALGPPTAPYAIEPKISSASSSSSSGSEGTNKQTDNKWLIGLFININDFLRRKVIKTEENARKGDIVLMYHEILKQTFSNMLGELTF